MNRKHFLRTASGLALACAAGLAAASTNGTAAEAEAMVRKAAALIKSAGSAKAFEEITNSPAFKDRDLYVFVYDLNGKCVAHGLNSKLIGKDLIGMKDPDGKPIIKLIVDLAKDKGKGWTDTVKFRNPVNDQIQNRVTYVERVGEYVVGSGIYKD